MVKKTPAYKNRLRAMELERSGGTTNKKKSNKQINKYELIKSFFDSSIRFHRCHYGYDKVGYVLMAGNWK
jgi:hypothetical protein